MFFPGICRPLAIQLLLAAGLGCTSGCLSTGVKWHQPDYAKPRWSAARKIQPKSIPSRASDASEELYAEALELERCGDACCVDRFFQVAHLTCPRHGPCSCDRTRQLHRSALLKLVVTGQQFGRLDPRRGLRVHAGGGEQLIPIQRYGFVWDSKHFERLVPVGCYHTNAIRNFYRRSGVGVPLVVTGCGNRCEPFLADQSVFAATLRMRVDEGCGPSEDDVSSASCRLELYDPLRVDKTTVGPQPLPITKDLTAPLVYRLRGRNRTFLSGFIDPGSAEGEGKLYAIEPYQTGKVPIVFIHGLLSDPFAWIEMVNELRARPGFVDRFQVWAFEYPTGRSFLGSATELREQLQAARASFDPHQQDRQLSNLVLVGHSMGGLISKLQITSSGDRLWRSVARLPIDQVRMPGQLRQQLQADFFFHPSPHVTRVVFLATPHRGSLYARRLVGRISSALVSMPEDQQRLHKQLIQCNPGVFRDEVSQRIPTSIDLLEPESGLLQAIDGLPVAPHVSMHSVIGDRCITLGHGRSDGVVPVDKAIEPRAVSQRMVRATHTQIKQHPDTVEELLRILDLHLRTSQCRCIGQVNIEEVVPVEAGRSTPAGSPDPGGRATAPLMVFTESDDR